MFAEAQFGVKVAVTIFSVHFLGTHVTDGLTTVTDLEQGLIRQKAPISYKQCKDACDSSVVCMKVKYFRNFKLCKLFNSEVATDSRSRDFVVYTKPQRLHDEHASMYAQCDTGAADVTAACEPVSCPNPAAIFNQHGAELVQGNSQVIGSVVKYRCTDDNYTDLSTCRTDGTWSWLQCKCRVNASFDFKIVRSSETRITVTQICPAYTNLIEPKHPSCELKTGMWRGNTSTCCEPASSEWMQVFNLSYGFHPDYGILTAWRSGIPNEPFLDRSDTIDIWNTLGITRVKVDVVKDRQTAVSMIFNGCGSTNEHWFSLGRLLESSWSSIGLDSTVDVLSVAGFSNYRFLISEYRANDEGCDQGNMWLTLTKIDPIACPDRTTFKILYSPRDGPVLLKDMEQADSFIVSIIHK